jgi:pimeloyl-ACP methyl ester carboxylesterase
MDFSPEKKRVMTDKGDIYYFAAGPEGSNQTVILLHGLSSNHTTWLTLMEKLAAQGIRSIAPDLRGHGFSDKSKRKEWYTLPVFAEDVRLIAEQERLQEFDMVGYSFGGYVSLAYAAANPGMLRRLALVSTNFMNPLHYQTLSPAAPILAKFFDGLAWFSYPQRRTHYHYFEQGKSTGYFESTFTGLFTMPLSVNFWTLAQTLRLDLSESLPLIACPTLIVRSMTDPYLTEQEVADMSRKIKNAHAVTIAGDGHFLASRNQDDLAGKLLPFLMNDHYEISSPKTSPHSQKSSFLAKANMAKNIEPGRQRKIGKTRTPKKSSTTSSAMRRRTKPRTSSRSAMK